MASSSGFPRDFRDKAELGSPLATATWGKLSTPWAPGAVWLGRDEAGQAIGHRDDRHMVTVAGSRAGKGRSAIVPNLLTWPHSALVLDPKGENATLTAATRARLPHHRVVVLDPYGVAKVEGSLRAGFNPLDLIDGASDEAIDLVAAIGDALTVSGSSKDVHWDESGRMVIEGLLLHVLTSPDKSSTLGQVRRLLLEGDPDAAARLTALKVDQAFMKARNAALKAGASEEDADAAGNEAAGKVKPVKPFAALWLMMRGTDAANPYVASVIRGVAEAILDMGENERGSVLSTARRNTKFLDTPAVADNLALSGFDPDALKAHAGGLTVYVCLPARAMPTHARWLRLVVNLTLTRLEMAGLAQPASGGSVLFVLDEFAALGRMEAIEKAAGLMAGFGVKLWPILQDLAQLKRHYAESWETFLGNAGCLQFFGNTDLTTLEWVSKRMGQTEIERETSSRSSSKAVSASTTWGESKQLGRSYQSGTADGVSDMAALSAQATREGGEGFLGLLGRANTGTDARSHTQSQGHGLTQSNSNTAGGSSSESKTDGMGATISLHTIALMSLDEIATHFDRESGRQVIFIGGGRPVCLHRSNWDSDKYLHNAYSGS